MIFHNRVTELEQIFENLVRNNQLQGRNVNVEKRQPKLETLIQQLGHLLTVNMSKSCGSDVYGIQRDSCDIGFRFHSFDQNSKVGVEVTQVDLDGVRLGSIFLDNPKVNRHVGVDRHCIIIILYIKVIDFLSFVLNIDCQVWTIKLLHSREKYVQTRSGELDWKVLRDVLGIGPEMKTLGL